MRNMRGDEVRVRRADKQVEGLRVEVGRKSVAGIRGGIVGEVVDESELEEFKFDVWYLLVGIET